MDKNYDLGQNLAEFLIEELESWDYPVELDGVVYNDSLEAASGFATSIYESQPTDLTVDVESFKRGFLSKFD